MEYTVTYSFQIKRRKDDLLPPTIRSCLIYFFASGSDGKTVSNILASVTCPGQLSITHLILETYKRSIYQREHNSRVVKVSGVDMKFNRGKPHIFSTKDGCGLISLAKSICDNFEHKFPIKIKRNKEKKNHITYTSL